MFERFTDRARKVMALANQEAQRFNHEAIGPEHILLGMVKEANCLGVMILTACGIDPRKVRLEVEKLVKSGPDMLIIGKLPQTPRAKKVIDLAIEAARKMEHNYIGSEHLLAGLLVEIVPGDSIAATVLVSLGLTPEKWKEAFEKIACEDSPKGDIAAERGRTFSQWFAADMARIFQSDSSNIGLRDYFAAKALTGILANEKLCGLTPEEKAQGAYNVADAMIKARQ